MEPRSAEKVRGWQRMVPMDLEVLECKAAEDMGRGAGDPLCI